MLLAGILYFLTFTVIQAQRNINKNKTDLLLEEISMDLKSHRKGSNHYVDRNANTDFLPWQDLTYMELPKLLTQNKGPETKDKMVNQVPDIFDKVPMLYKDLNMASLAVNDDEEKKTDFNVFPKSANLEEQNRFVPQITSHNVLIKDKIVALSKDTVDRLESQVDVVSKLHEKFKRNHSYKLGFLMCYVFKTRDGINDLMAYIDKNKQNWDVLQLLNAYEKLKKAKDFLAASLSVLRQYPPPPTTAPSPQERGGQIAWSYYDDDIGG